VDCPRKFRYNIKLRKNEDKKGFLTKKEAKKKYFPKEQKLERRLSQNLLVFKNLTARNELPSTTDVRLQV
jgi:hypothetical protein